jgi:hypothetical protein
MSAGMIIRLVIMRSITRRALREREGTGKKSTRGPWLRRSLYNFRPFTFRITAKFLLLTATPGGDIGFAIIIAGIAGCRRGTRSEVSVGIGSMDSCVQGGRE